MCGDCLFSLFCLAGMLELLVCPRCHSRFYHVKGIEFGPYAEVTCDKAWGEFELRSHPIAWCCRCLFYTAMDSTMSLRAGRHPDGLKSASLVLIHSGKQPTIQGS